MIDLLAEPIRQLTQQLGTGVVPDGGPSDLLRSAGEALSSTGSIASSSIGKLADVWSGPASEAATMAVTEAVRAVGAIHAHGNELGVLLSRATACVQTGNLELAAILESFLGWAAAAAPTLITPAGQAALVAVASEHLTRAMAVVARVRAELDVHTSSALALTAPPTVPGIGGQGASQKNPVLDMVGQWVKQVASTHPSGENGHIEPAQHHTEPTAANERTGHVGKEGVGELITLPDGSTATAPNAKAAAAVRFALEQQGTPYVWGGTTPGQGLDCSGLTQAAYADAGVDIPRLAGNQDIGTAIGAADVMPGDLAVWDGHVAMVVGNGQMVEAGDPVSVSSIRTTNSGMAFHGFYRPTT